MGDFITSTHRAKWIFSPQDLKEKHKAANQRAKQALEKYGTTRMEVDVDGSFSYAEPLTDAKFTGEKRPKALKVEEEQLLRAFYESKIQDVCDAFKFPCKIQATALIYFKRFYLQWSVMEHHPKNIMLTCIYTACKAEENHVSAEELGKGIEQDHHVILNNEMLVLQSLDFDLIVFAPYRAVEGFLNDIEEFCGTKDQHINSLKNLFESAKKEADKIMLTDATLLFPPGQLALAALRRANGIPGVLDFDRYLERILAHQQASNAILDLSGPLNAIDSMINKLVFPSPKDVKHIDRKLKACLDPGLHDKSKKRKHRSNESSNDVPNLA
ncbi:unnamed protein product [Cuscuta campestris]|uniref:Cyclin-like domain-containing protein n=1 Tax=Cuscuta campestris TaxID=132261 RepID=A0A484KLZ4_9ASTE|nr:unnamed protein product [Cuscuta campestris]